MTEVLARVRAAGGRPVSAVLHYKPSRSRVAGPARTTSRPRSRAGSPTRTRPAADAGNLSGTSQPRTVRWVATGPHGRTARSHPRPGALHDGPTSHRQPRPPSHGHRDRRPRPRRRGTLVPVLPAGRARPGVPSARRPRRRPPRRPRRPRRPTPRRRTAPGSADPGSTAVAAGDGITGTWTIDPSVGSFSDFSGTFVGYRVQETLASIGAQTAVGRTPDVTGTVTADGHDHHRRRDHRRPDDAPERRPATRRPAQPPGARDVAVPDGDVQADAADRPRLGPGRRRDRRGDGDRRPHAPRRHQVGPDPARGPPRRTASSRSSARCRSSSPTSGSRRRSR